MSDGAPYRDFTFPLNVFMHILSSEEGRARYLHYGFFESEGEPIDKAQERSTEMLLARLPPPPARILEAGIGLGTTLARLTDAGYDAEGITPDEHQIAAVRARYGDGVRVSCASFESFAGGPFDSVLFQESSQYIDSMALFAAASRMTGHIIVADEFATRPLPGELHDYDTFMGAAATNGFRVIEELDVSAMAAPSMRYVMDRIARYRQSLIEDLGVTAEQLDALVESGGVYQQRYDDGTYVYRILQFVR